MAHVRDRRDADWFWMNKSVIDVYGAKIGVHGIAVYALLAKCANQEGHAIPSLRYMAQKLNIGTSTVQRYLEILVENKLIERQRRTSEHGGFTSTEYILLTIKNIDKGGVSVGDTPVPVENTPVSTADTGVFTGDTPVSAVNGQVYPQQIGRASGRER